MIFRPGPRTAALLSLAAGAMAAFAHPPFGVLPGLAGYGLMMILADQAPGPRPLRAAFWRGWLAAFAYFLVGCWWVAEAFLVDARGQGWMAPFAVMLLPAGLGLFWGAAMALYRWIRPAGPWRIVVFASALTALEWLRGHVLTGFPWNLPGETWAAGSAVSQAASVVGAYGLTWLTLALAAAVLEPLGNESPRRAWWAPPAAAACILAAFWAWGAVRLTATDPSWGAPLTVRIVQPDVPQLAKYDEGSFRWIFQRYVDLTARPAARRPQVVIWSEGAIPEAANDYMAPGTWTARAIARALGPDRTLLVGAYRAQGAAAHPAFFNSLIAVRARGDDLEVTGVYDKFKLVPFGEYLPAEQILQPLGFKDLTHVGDSFTAGPPPAPISPPGAPTVLPLICYESLFPDLVRDAVRRGRTRPGWIVNVSNDAWFGVTSGPTQHLNQASYRAIETGLPIVRATPNGVSAVIDAYGRLVPGAKLGLRVSGVIDAQLPQALNITTYGRLGDSPLGGIVLLTLLLSGWRVLSSLHKKPVTTPP